MAASVPVVVLVVNVESSVTLISTILGMWITLLRIILSSTPPGSSTLAVEMISRSQGETAEEASVTGAVKLAYGESLNLE